MAEKRIDASRRGEAILTTSRATLLLFAVGVETPPEDILVPHGVVPARVSERKTNQPETIELKPWTRDLKEAA